MKIRSLRLCAPWLAAFALVGCGQSDSAESQDKGSASSDETVADARAGSVVEVAARDFAFDAPAELPSGWTMLRFENLGAQEHFMSISRLPVGKSVEDYINEVAAGAFGTAMDPYYKGEVDLPAALETLGSLVPAWFGDMEFSGGPGLLAPGRSELVTVNLAPGNYVLECYVKTPEGMFHSALGMIAGLTVTEEATGAPAPEANFDVTLANYVIEAPEAVAAGEHTIRVRVLQDPEGMLKHDVHLFRVGENTDLAAVISWMSWIDGMMAPAPVTFIGGFEQLEAGGTGYVHVDLEPGTYAWISEAYADRGMVKEFVVE
jgi:hypothetical protein